MGLADAEEAWARTTAEEEVALSGFSEPLKLRRPGTGVNALAALKFGSYKDFANAWHQDNRVIWLSYIMSEQPGDGTVLLEQIRGLAELNGLAICGEPVPLKPRNWPPGRGWDGDRHRLICWYLRHGFRVVQTKYESRFWYIPAQMDFDVSVKLTRISRLAGFFHWFANRH